MRKMKREDKEEDSFYCNNRTKKIKLQYEVVSRGKFIYDSFIEEVVFY